MWVLILLPIHIPCFRSRGSQLGAVLYPHPGIFGDVYRPFLLSQLGWMEGEALLVYSRLRPGVLLSLLHGAGHHPHPPAPPRTTKNDPAWSVNTTEAEKLGSGFLLPLALSQMGLSPLCWTIPFAAWLHSIFCFAHWLSHTCFLVPRGQAWFLALLLLPSCYSLLSCGKHVGGSWQVQADKPKSKTLKNESSSYRMIQLHFTLRDKGL